MTETKHEDLKEYHSLQPQLHDMDDAGEKLEGVASLLSTFRSQTLQLESDITAKFQRELHGMLDKLVHDAQIHVGRTTGAQLQNNSAVVAKIEQQPRKSNGMPHRKEFILRNSLLTDIMEISHIRTIRAIFVAVFTIFTIALFLSESILQGSIAFDLWLIQWGIGKFSSALLAWVCIQLSSAFLLFLPFSIWSTRRTGGKLQANFFDYFMLTYYIGYFAALSYFPTRFIWNNDLPPASAVFLAAEQVRMMMKTHSFVREKAVDAFTSETGTVEPSFSKFLYFLFAPTTIYRDSYPRSAPPIQWTSAVYHLASFVGGVSFIGHLFQHFTIPVFRSLDYTNGISIRLFTQCVFSTTIPSLTMNVFVFFCLLHAWQNMFAEVLRFGDRQFYLDWWNSTNFATWYRTWNIVVHDWLHQYVYRDLVLVFKRPSSRALCQLATFLFSAIIHEYFVVLIFHSVFPVMFMLFSSGGVLMFFLHSGKGNQNFASVTVWMSLLLGYGLLISFYSMEWYSRLYCPSIFVSEDDKWKDFYVPRMLTCGWNATTTDGGNNNSAVLPINEAVKLATEQCVQ